MWYENQKNLAEAIGFVMQYSCIYGWTAIVSGKTPCSNYREDDQNIPEGLKQAIGEYLDNLSVEEGRSLNAELALLLGERFFVRRTAIIKVLSRILASGDPRDNKDIIRFALQTQIKQRMDLLETLRAC